MSDDILRLVLQQKFHQFLEFSLELGEMDWFRLDFHCAGFEPGEAQKIIDEIPQGARVALNAFDRLIHVLRQGFLFCILHQEFAIPQNDMQRSAQFMRNICQ